jgi:hypothetical protein
MDGGQKGLLKKERRRGPITESTGMMEGTGAAEEAWGRESG